MSSLLNTPSIAQFLNSRGGGFWNPVGGGGGGAPAGGWTPSDYGTPLLWYDVSQETSFSDTDPVATLQDFNGSNDATNAVSDATRPNYDEDAFGTGKPGVVFDADGGNLDVLSLATDLNFTGDFTVIAAVKANSVDSALLGNDTVDTRLECNAASAVVRLKFNGGTTVSSPTFAMPVATDRYIVVWRRSGTKVYQRVMLADEFDAGTTYTDTGVLNTVGNSAGSTLPADITIGELVAYGEVLTDSELETVHWILVNKWRGIGPRVNENFESYSLESPVVTALEGGDNWADASSLNHSDMETGLKSEDDFEDYTPASPTAEVLNGGTGFTNDWDYQDMDTGIKADDDLESYSLESPITSTLNAGTGFPSAWSFSDN